MGKPWHESDGSWCGVFDVQPGAKWGTVIIDGETHEIDDLYYWGKCGTLYDHSAISIRDGNYKIDLIPAERDWVGENFPAALRRKWSIHWLRRW